MRTISRSGFAAVEGEFRARRRAVLVHRLRVELHIVPEGMSDPEVLGRIEPIVAGAVVLGFAESDNDLLRFVALAFLPEADRQDPFFSAALQRCLGNENLHPSDRLDFVYRHIVPKMTRRGLRRLS